MKTLTINTTIISNAVATASIFTARDGDFAGKIVLVGQEGKIILSDLQKSTVVEDVFEDKNASLRFGLNSKLVLDFLASYDGEKVQLGFNESNLPFLLIADPSYSELVMPIVLADTQEVEENVAV